MRKLILGFLFINIFSTQAQSWDEIIKVVASDRAAGDNFGHSVAISGNYAVVGVPRESEDVSGGNTLQEAGSAYIFEKNGSGSWVFQQKIVASNRAEYDSFGQSVAIDGDYIIVGTPFENNDALGANPVANAGCAYIFERNSSGNWLQIQKIVASDRAVGDNFGCSVSISNNFIIVGAHFEDENAAGTGTMTNAGSAYIFERVGNDWIQQQKIVASDRGASDRFGMNVSISGSYAIVGTRFDGKDANGSNILTQAGSAYIFERDGNNNWAQSAKIVASDREAGSYFGISVAISGDYAIIGASGEDKDVSGGNNIDDAGAAYIFERNSSGNWIQQQKIIASDREELDNFGHSVSVSGIRAVVGARLESQDATGGNTLSEAGSAYIFERNGSGNWLQAQKIVASDRGAQDEFGSSVAISNNNIIIGAPKEDQDASGTGTLAEAGSAYIFSPGCTPGTSIYTDTACNSFTWTSGNGQTYTSSNNTATHVIPNSAANGCDSIITLNLTIKITTAVSLSGTTLTAHQAGATYQWIDCDNGNTPIPGETSQSFTFIPNSNGSYSVEITADGCTATSNCIAVNSAGIENNSFLSGTSIYPNPTNGYFVIDIPGDFQLKITDLTGRTIMETIINEGKNQLELNEIPGVYLLNFTSENGQFIQRITVK